MARKSTGEAGGKAERGQKSRLIKEHLHSSPQMKNPEIAEAITRRGVPCKAQDVANMRTKLKKLGLLPGGRGSSAPLTIDDVLKVKELATQAGGVRTLEKNIQELEALAAHLGGLERLKRGIAALNSFYEKTKMPQ